MSWDKVGLPTKLRHWYGDMEVEGYLYTAGIAGEKFFKTLKERGKLLASRCMKCDVSYLPARAYCPSCFSEITEYFEVEPEGNVETYTILRVGVDGEKLEEPVIVAFITFDGVNGGLIHRLGEMDEKDVEIGMRVKAVLKPTDERRGEITDILYFKPA